MDRKLRIIDGYIVEVEHNDEGTWGAIYNADGQMISGGRLSEKSNEPITCYTLFSQYPPVR